MAKQKGSTGYASPAGGLGLCKVSCPPPTWIPSQCLLHWHKEWYKVLGQVKSIGSSEEIDKHFIRDSRQLLHRVIKLGEVKVNGF